MNNGANTLSYNLYTTAARTTIWGDGTSGTSFLNPPNSNGLTSPGAFTMTVFGQVPAQALPPNGMYQDSVTATITCTNGGACTSGSTQTLVIPITATVGGSCTIAANNLNFGNYTGIVLDGTTTLSATCSSGAPYNIGLDQGASTGATVRNRAMTGPGRGNGAKAPQELQYSLFSDSARTINWGNTVGTDTVPSTGTGSAQSFTVFGRVPAGQAPRPGAYQDTITVTLTF